MQEQTCTLTLVRVHPIIRFISTALSCPVDIILQEEMAGRASGKVHLRRTVNSIILLHVVFLVTGNVI